MKEKSLQYIISLIKTNIMENVPTVSASTGQISGVSSGQTPPNVNDLPPIDLRKKKYKKLPIFYKDLFRRSSSVQSKYNRRH